MQTEFIGMHRHIFLHGPKTCAKEKREVARDMLTSILKTISASGRGEIMQIDIEGDDLDIFQVTLFGSVLSDKLVKDVESAILLRAGGWQAIHFRDGNMRRLLSIEAYRLFD